MKIDKTTIGRRISFVFVVLLYLIAGSAIFVPLLFCAGFMLAPGFSTEPNRREVTDPGGEFTHFTGLELPESAIVVSSGDVSIDFLGDGEFYLVFEVDHATLKQWLAESPPWNQGGWDRDPVQTDIRWRCGFGISGMGADPAGGGPYRNPDKTIGQRAREQVLSSKHSWYVARESCCEEARWEIGEILIIDLEHNRVWYSSWKF